MLNSENPEPGHGQPEPRPLSLDEQIESFRQQNRAMDEEYERMKARQREFDAAVERIGFEFSLQISRMQGMSWALLNFNGPLPPKPSVWERIKTLLCR